VARTEISREPGEQDRRVADPVVRALRQLGGDDPDRDVLRLEVGGDAGVAVEEGVLEFPAVGERYPEGVQAVATVALDLAGAAPAELANAASKVTDTSRTAKEPRSAFI
jgi:hypothetical protein